MGDILEEESETDYQSVDGNKISLGLDGNEDEIKTFDKNDETSSIGSSSEIGINLSKTNLQDNRKEHLNAHRIRKKLMKRNRELQDTIFRYLRHKEGGHQKTNEDIEIKQEYASYLDRLKNLSDAMDEEKLRNQSEISRLEELNAIKQKQIEDQILDFVKLKKRTAKFARHKTGGKFSNEELTKLLKKQNQQESKMRNLREVRMRLEEKVEKLNKDLELISDVKDDSTIMNCDALKTENKIYFKGINDKNQKIQNAENELGKLKENRKLLKSRLQLIFDKCTQEKEKLEEELIIYKMKKQEFLSRKSQRNKIRRDVNLLKGSMELLFTDELRKNFEARKCQFEKLKNQLKIDKEIA